MFSVKHIEPGHDEVLYLASGVRRTQCSGSNEPPAGVHLSLANGTKAYLEGGTVYVMNEAGSTVAKYELGNADAEWGLTQGRMGLHADQAVAQMIAKQFQQSRGIAGEGGGGEHGPWGAPNRLDPAPAPSLRS